MEPNQLATRMHTWYGLMRPEGGTLQRMGPMLQLGAAPTAAAAAPPPLRGGDCPCAAGVPPHVCVAILCGCVTLAVVALVVYFGILPHLPPPRRRRH